MKIQDNLCKIFGFAENLNLSDPNKTLLDNEHLLTNCDTDDENMPDKVIEVIPDQSNTAKNTLVRTTSFYWMYTDGYKKLPFYLEVQLPKMNMAPLLNKPYVMRSL